MSIHNDHVEYAKKVRMPVNLAKIWCTNQLEIKEEMNKAKICPKCEKPTLELELGSYEEGYNDYVYCVNNEILAIDDDGEEYYTDCDYTSEPKNEHEPLSCWYDFDVLLAHSIGYDESRKHDTDLQEWLKFVREEVGKIKPA